MARKAMYEESSVTVKGGVVFVCDSSDTLHVFRQDAMVAAEFDEDEDGDESTLTVYLASGDELEMWLELDDEEDFMNDLFSVKKDKKGKKNNDSEDDSE
jgi:hypothetical protein